MSSHYYEHNYPPLRPNWNSLQFAFGHYIGHRLPTVKNLHGCSIGQHPTYNSIQIQANFPEFQFDSEVAQRILTRVDSSVYQKSETHYDQSISPHLLQCRDDWEHLQGNPRLP